MRSSEIKPEVYDLARRAEALAAPQFTLLQEVCEKNTQRVMDAFQEFRVSEACFAGTTGYGYDDLGRETLEKIYARVWLMNVLAVRLGSYEVGGWLSLAVTVTGFFYTVISFGSRIFQVSGKRWKIRPSKL